MACSGLAAVQRVQALFWVLVHGVFWNEPIWHTVHWRQDAKPVVGVYDSAGHVVAVMDDSGQNEPHVHVTGVAIPMFGQKYPGGQGVRRSSEQLLPLGHRLHCHWPRGAEALRTL